MQRASGGDRKIEQQRVTPAALNIVFAFAGCVVFVVASPPRMNAAASSLVREVGQRVCSQSYLCSYTICKCAHAPANTYTFLWGNAEIGFRRCYSRQDFVETFHAASRETIALLSYTMIWQRLDLFGKVGFANYEDLTLDKGSLDRELPRIQHLFWWMYHFSKRD